MWCPAGPLQPPTVASPAPWETGAPATQTAIRPHVPKVAAAQYGPPHGDGKAPVTFVG